MICVRPAPGWANDALAKALADVFAIAPSAVSITAGEKSRTKRFRLTVEDVEVFAQRLDDLVAGATSGPGPVDRDKWRSS